MIFCELIIRAMLIKDPCPTRSQHKMIIKIIHVGFKLT